MFKGLLRRSGEVVEDVAPPLPLATPLLLVKPPAGLATPAVFRALDLGGRSTADPRALLAALAGGGSGAASPELRVPAEQRVPRIVQAPVCLTFRSYRVCP